MWRFPRSLSFYVIASTVYAAAVFISVHIVWAVELGRAGIRLPDADSLIGSIDVVSFIVWLGISLIAGVVLHRLASALEGARDESTQREAELGSLFALSSALSGTVELEDVARQFLEAARRILDPTVTASVIVYDEAAEAFRIVAQDGPRSSELAGRTYPVSAMPAVVRSRVVDHRQSLVFADTATAGAPWENLVAEQPELLITRSFGLLPLVARDRLAGLLMLRSDTENALDADRLQLPMLMGHYVAGAILSAQSIKEAEDRVERESIISRVAERARSSLDPDEILRATVTELGRNLGVSRALVAVGRAADDLRITYQWNKDGVTPLADGTERIPVSRYAAGIGRTVVVRDIRSDRRFVGQLPDESSGLGVVGAIATPIQLGPELAGAVSLHQTDGPRDWTVNEVRLVEAVARELRTAVESSRLYQVRERENERLLALHRASAVLAAQTDPRKMMDELLSHAVSLLGRGNASLYTWYEQEQVLRLTQSVEAGGHPVTAQMAAGEGLAGKAFSTLAPVIVNDYQAWEGATQSGRDSGVRCGLAVPLIRSGSALGALVVRSYDDVARFTDDDARMLTLFGDQAAAALTTVEAFERQRNAMEQLEKLNTAKSEFVSIVSHEFRTPLTGIQGFSEMMRDEDLSMREIKEYAGDINKDAQRLNRMINEMLDLDRMESGRMSMHPDALDLNGLASEVAERMQPNAPNHRITTRLDPGLPNLVADRDRMTQVVSNLLSNAIKYSPSGGEITLTTRLEGDHAHLLVRDRGMGIPKDSLETVFERYSRVESRTTRHIEGTGLGLPIVRQIVELHGGRVWAESEPGEGSIFHVVLPLAGRDKPVEA